VVTDVSTDSEGLFLKRLNVEYDSAFEVIPINFLRKLREYE